jgi:hypothetical protein
LIFNPIWTNVYMCQSWSFRGTHGLDLTINVFILELVNCRCIYFTRVIQLILIVCLLSVFHSTNILFAALIWKDSY